MTYDHFRNIIGIIVVIAIIFSGIFAIDAGNLIVGWVWTVCGLFIAIIALNDMWRRYK